MVVDLGVVQQDLGGDAADVQTGAAEEGIFLDDDGLETQLAGADGRHVAAWTAPDNRYIVLGHAQSPFGRVRTHGSRSRIDRQRTEKKPSTLSGADGRIPPNHKF